MPRQKLRSRRPQIISQFCINPVAPENTQVWFYPAIGFAHGKPIEVFLSCNKTADIEPLGRDGAILMSLLLQHGCDFDTMRAAITREEPDAEHPNGRASSLIGQVLDEIGKIAEEEVDRILSEFRMPSDDTPNKPERPAEPGPEPEPVEPKPSPTTGDGGAVLVADVETIPAAIYSLIADANKLPFADPKEMQNDGEPIKQAGIVPRSKADLLAEARGRGYMPEPCQSCFNYTLTRNGTCMKCHTCGSTSGCS